MKNISVRKYLYGCLCLAFLFLFSCKKDLTKFAESYKEITGTWKIVELTRNSEDMTSRMDLSKFRIIFNGDNTYTLQDQFPFFVTEPGTYRFDDPQYPFFLNFQVTGSTTENKVSFEYPIVNGKRQIKLTITLGCNKNSYVYYFEKE
ncbi:MAG TPA: DUF5004 domain-containing protein [Bacteroidales bacterium]